MNLNREKRHKEQKATTCIYFHVNLEIYKYSIINEYMYVGYKKFCKAIQFVLRYTVSDMYFITPIKPQNFTCKQKLLQQFDRVYAK
jgi:hypothetical protein